MIVTTVTYPGINQIESITATIDHGITPSQIQLNIAPQAITNIALIGDLTITYDGTTINYKNCVADRATYQYNRSGEVIAMTLLDFRWAWTDGTISGIYNLKNEDGTVRVIDGAMPSTTDAIGNSEKTPQELAELLLDAMGVANYDVTDLPNDTRPSVEWSFANPAQELSRLVAPLGCSIVPTIDGDVNIRQLGVGVALPTTPLESGGATLDPANPPKRIGIVCDETRYQLDFDLEAVGLDTDGNIKLLNDLSFTPAGGWQENDEFFLDITDEKALELARSCLLYTSPSPRD